MDLSDGVAKLNLYSGAVQATVAMILLVVTAIYAALTWRIAKETGAMVVATREAVQASNRLADLARQQVKAANEQVEAAKQQVDSALAQVAAAREQVSVSQRQADLTREALEASIQPILVDVPRGVFRETQPLKFGLTGYSPYIHDLGDVFIEVGSEYARVSVPFRNVGSGPALVITSSVNYGPESWIPTSVSQTIVRSDEVTRISFEEPKDAPRLQACLSGILDGGATVNLVYTNVGNRGKRRTAGTIWPNGDGTFRVRQILLYEDDVAEPFAVSGPMD